MADQSKMKRLEVGDKVSYTDASDFPPVQYEGEIKEFTNEECTYLSVELYAVGDEKAKAVTKELTEDEVNRI